MRSYNSFVLLLVISGIGISTSVQAQQFEWAKKMNGYYTDYASSAATDSNGNIIITGYFSGTIDFDPGPGFSMVTSSGLFDVFIEKFDSLGNMIWVKTLGDTLGEEPGDIAVDSLCNIYVTGAFVGTVDFDPGPGVTNMTSTIDQDVFIMKLDPMGNLIWAKQFVGTSEAKGMALAVAKNFEVYVAGNSGGTADFDPGPGVFNLSSNGSGDIFLCKLNATGLFQWATITGGTGNDIPYDMFLTETGNIFLTGQFDSTVDFDPGPGVVSFTGLGNTDIFITSYDTSGNLFWAKQVGAPGQQNSFGITADKALNVYVTGTYTDTVDFDPGPGVLTAISNPGSHFFLLKLDVSGNFLWLKEAGSNLYNAGHSVITDDSNYVYLTGEFTQTVDFDFGPALLNFSATGNGPNVFIVKYDSSGNMQWAKQLKGLNGYTIPAKSVLDRYSNLYTTGYFGNTVDFDPGPSTFNLTASFLSDVYIHKLSACSITQSTIQVDACNSYISPSGDQTWTSTGIYKEIIHGTTTCDSIITINLTIHTAADTSVSQNNTILTANANNASYQWIDCDNGSTVIPGATGQVFVAPNNGYYAVIVAENGCTDTSSCYEVTGIFIEEINTWPAIQVYPNPASSQLSISGIDNGYEIVLSDIRGNILYETVSTGNKTVIDISFLVSGIYILRISDDKKIYYSRLIKS